MNKTHTLAISALALLTLVVGASSFAATSTTDVVVMKDPTMMGRMHGNVFFARSMMGQSDDALTQAIQANDYDAFIKALTAKLPSKEQFATMVAEQAKQQAVKDAITANDYDAFVKAIAAMQTDKTNNGKTMPTPTKEEFAKMVTMHTQQVAIQKAIDANDYSAFVTAAKDSPLAISITTQEKFNQLVQFHTAMKNNDTATLQKLKDVGFTPPMIKEGKRERMKGKKFHTTFQRKSTKTLKNQTTKAPN